MPLLNDLPDELIGHIAVALTEPEVSGSEPGAFASIWSSDAPVGGLESHRIEASSRKTLRPMLLVSRRINIICTPHFWKEVALSEKSPEQLLEFVRDIAPQRAEYVRRIRVPSVAFLNPESFLAQRPKRQTLPNIAAAVRSCGDLKAITLYQHESDAATHGPAIVRLDISAWPSLVNLTTLELRGYGPYVEIDAAALLASLPQLQAFHISLDINTDDLVIAAPLFAGLRQHRHLIHLRISVLSIYANDWLSGLEILPWSCPLESFTFFYRLGRRRDTVLSLMAGCFGKTLREVNIKLDYPGIGSQVKVHLPNLRLLTIDLYGGQPEVPPTRHPLLAFEGCRRLHTLSAKPLWGYDALVDPLSAIDATGTASMWPELRFFRYDYLGELSGGRLRTWDETRFEGFESALRHGRSVTVWFGNTCRG